MHHFLKETDFTPEQAQHVFLLAKQFKDDRLNCPQNIKNNPGVYSFIRVAPGHGSPLKLASTNLVAFP